MKTNLILVGVSGFLGQRFLEESQYLRNNYNIICCTSSLSGSSKINSIYCDSIITLKDLNIDFINNLSDFILINMAYSSSGTPWRRIIETKKLLLQLSNLCKESDNCKGFIEISSQSVFGYSLNSDINPWTKIPIVFNDYCQSKQEAEKIVIEKISPTNIPFAIVRVGNILGKGSLPWIDRPLRYLYTQNFEMLENLSGYSNCIYVKNLIDYLHFLLENKIPTSINNSVFHHLVDYPYLKWNELYKYLNNENLHFNFNERTQHNKSIPFLIKNAVIYLASKFFILINISIKVDEYVIFLLRTSQNLKRNSSKNKPIDLNLKVIYTEKNIFQKFLNINFNFKYSKEDLIKEVNNSILECQNPR
jgi:nucleoside-diphosphate-sugar epimerase